MENRDSKLDLSLKFYDEFFKVLDNYGYFHKDKKKLYLILRKKEEDESESDKIDILEQKFWFNTSKKECYFKADRGIKYELESV